MISVIMPSYLGEYPGCASNRPQKLRRSIESFLQQEIGELIVIADSCKHTLSICSEYPINLIYLNEKRPLFSGELRNIGIRVSKYDYITYLDSDDYFGEGHLQSITENLDTDWLWWDDYVVNDKRTVFLEHMGIGTSCIAHKKQLNAFWVEGYGHDWHFISQLMNHQGKKIEANYRVMHIPGYVDE